MILHAGDIVSLSVLHRLEQQGVIAVCGNMDDYEIIGALPQMRVVSAAGKRMGLIHGWGSREGLQRRILQRFQDPRPDLIVFGHSHTPFWGTVEGIPMFNPGQAVIRIRDGSVGIIEIEGDKVEGRFIPLHG
jgi:putative phosphoesterase